MAKQKIANEAIVMLTASGRRRYDYQSAGGEGTVMKFEQNHYYVNWPHGYGDWYSPEDIMEIPSESHVNNKIAVIFTSASDLHAISRQMVSENKVFVSEPKKIMEAVKRHGGVAAYYVNGDKRQGWGFIPRLVKDNYTLITTPMYTSEVEKTDLILYKLPDIVREGPKPKRKRIKTPSIGGFAEALSEVAEGRAIPVNQEIEVRTGYQETHDVEPMGIVPPDRAVTATDFTDVYRAAVGQRIEFRTPTISEPVPIPTWTSLMDDEVEPEPDGEE